MKEKQWRKQASILPAVFILIMGICVWLRPEAYVKEYVGGFAYAEYGFLQAGEYSLELTYTGAPAGSHAMVSSRKQVDEWNRQGVVFAEEEFVGQDGTMSMSFCLEEDTWDVAVSQDSGEEHRVFDRIKLQSVGLSNRDNYFIGGCLILFGVFVAVFGRKLTEERYRAPLVLALLGLGASLPLANDFLKWGHDINFHLARIEGVYQGLKSGAFPVRVNPVQLEGFGYLSASMYPQLFLYPAAIFRFLGVSTGLSYKLLLFAANEATAFLAYYSVKGITKSEKTGMLAAILYVFAPYRLIDMYTRAALGEALAMVFLPLAAWGLYEVLWGNPRKWFLLALGVSGVFQCHLLSTEMCLMFMVGTAFFRIITGEKKEMFPRIRYGLLSAAMFLLWNMGLWLPILFFSREGMQAYAIQNDLSRSAAYFSQMFSLFTESVGPNKPLGGTQGEMPLSVGALLPLSSLLLAVVLFRKERQEYTPAEKAGRYCLFLGGISLLLSSALFPWRTLQGIGWLNRVIAPIEFVWRFLAPASFLLCVAGAVGMVAFREKFEGSGWVLPVAGVILLCGTAYYFDGLSWNGEDMGDKMLIAGADERDASYLYEESDISDFSRENAVIQCSNNSEVEYSGYRKEGTSLTVRVSPKRVEEGAKLIFPLYGYTGYQVLVNGEPVEWERMNSRVACGMPMEESQIEVRYKGPGVFLAGDAIAWGSILGCAVFAGVKRARGSLRFFAKKA